jgi:putative ABC transport system substrate-binding protein
VIGTEEATMRLKILGIIVTLTLAIFSASCTSDSQPPVKVPRIGWLSSGIPPSEAERERALGLSSFLQGLRELGYVEGQNIVVEERYAEGQLERLPELAAELVQLRVDVIVAGDPQAILPAKQATSTIPIVMSVSADPVGSGLVASLARPGGNVTGLSNVAPQLAGKRLELLKEVVPGVSRVAVLGRPGQADWEPLAVATQALGGQLQALEVQSPDDIKDAFEAAVRERADVLIVLASPIVLRHSRLIVDLAAESRLPTMYPRKEYVQDGGLMYYGPSTPELHRRAAYYVDRILKGAKPGDLPVEQPTRFELVVNLKTAEALGITIPPSVLARADEVVQ